MISRPIIMRLIAPALITTLVLGFTSYPSGSEPLPDKPPPTFAPNGAAEPRSPQSDKQPLTRNYLNKLNGGIPLSRVDESIYVLPPPPAAEQASRPPMPPRPAQEPPRGIAQLPPPPPSAMGATQHARPNPPGMTMNSWMRHGDSDSLRFSQEYAPPYPPAPRANPAEDDPARAELPPALAKKRLTLKRRSRLENHALQGELMQAQDALEDVMAADRPDSKAVGAAYARIFDIQRRMIELRVRSKNALMEIWDEAQSHTRGNKDIAQRSE